MTRVARAARAPNGLLDFSYVDITFILQPFRRFYIPYLYRRRSRADLGDAMRFGSLCTIYVELITSTTEEADLSRIDKTLMRRDFDVESIRPIITTCVRGVEKGRF
ncbi:hypothetical protein EVAR_5129_1 [Eumeta japonica]|uniref:Uncharacterized protein n=1 Tax=Eumeta variegata TaxID=151549 RepID=A0A4C1SUC2_EUMVA|nr:hypothetical protein EVAR_5129_1 [Eumeta japonica]